MLPTVIASGLSRESCEPQEGKEVMVKCKGDTCTDSGAVPATPRGVHTTTQQGRQEPQRRTYVMQTS